MKSAVLHLGEMSSQNIVTSPNFRISQFLATLLNIPLITELNQDEYAEQGFDTLFVKYAHRRNEKLAAIFQRTPRIVVLENDYMMRQPTWLTDQPCIHEYIHWTTIPDNLMFAQDHYVNWNVVPFSNGGPTDFNEAPLFPGALLYYGGPRQNRMSSFNRFMYHTPYPVHFSAPLINSGEVARIDRNIIQQPMFTQPHEFRNYIATLYIEDERSHNEFHSPANRFYEALEFGLALLIDEKAAHTLDKAGFDTDERSIVRSPSDIASCLTYADKIRRGQRKAWRRDFIAELKQQIFGAYSKL